MLQGIETIFDDLEQMLHHLKKKSYEANTEVFVRENGFYFEEMKEYVEAAAESAVCTAEQRCADAAGIQPIRCPLYGTGIQIKRL